MGKGPNADCPRFYQYSHFGTYVLLNSKFTLFFSPTNSFLANFTRMQPEMRCGWSRLVDGPLGKQGVKGHVEEFSKEVEGRQKGRACEV